MLNPWICRSLANEAESIRAFEKKIFGTLLLMYRVTPVAGHCAESFTELSHKCWEEDLEVGVIITSPVQAMPANLRKAK